MKINTRKVILFMMAFVMLLPGCKKDSNIAMSDNSLEGMAFTISGQHALYTDNKYKFEVTVPASYPFYYEFDGEPIFPNQNDIQSSSEITEISPSRYLHIYFQFKDDDLKRNNIEICGQLGQAVGWLNDFSGESSVIQTHLGKRGTLKRHKDGNGVELIFCLDDGHQYIKADFSKAAYDAAKNAIMDIIYSLEPIS